MHIVVEAGQSCMTAAPAAVPLPDGPRAAILVRFATGIAYFIAMRNLQTQARKLAWSLCELVSHISANTADEDVEWLVAIVLTTERKGYKTRRWAPVRPGDSAILDHAKLPHLSIGHVLVRIIISRFFAVTSSRLNAWHVPCDASDYYNHSIQPYRPFGQRGHADYVSLFHRALHAFTCADAVRFVESCDIGPARPLTMRMVNQLVGRSLTSSSWTAHLVLNDFATIFTPALVAFDCQYERASSKGCGVPISDSEVEVVRQHINASSRCTFMNAPLERHEIKHVLCEVRQWGIWAVAGQAPAKQVAQSKVELVHQLAKYMQRDLSHRFRAISEAPF